MATVFRCIHSRDSFQVSKMLVQWPKIQLLDTSFCFCWPFCLCKEDSTSLPPLAFLWQPWTLLGCHITPSPLCCLSSAPFTPSHSPHLPHCLFNSACVLSVEFRNGVIMGQPEKHPPMSCLSAVPLSLATLPPFSLAVSVSILLRVSCLWQLCVTFTPKTHCPSQMLPIIPCRADT